MHEDLVKSRRKIPGWLMPALGYTLSAASLVWVFHDFNFQTLADVASVDWRYVVSAVIFELLVYLCHAWRWNMLLRPVARVPFWRSVQAIFIGLYANSILPLRTGEVIRCYLVAHWNNIPISLVISSFAIERSILDGIWLVVALLITTHQVSLPPYLIEGTELMGLGICFLLGLFLFIAIHKQRAQAVFSETGWTSGLRHIIEGIHAMGNWRTLLGATVVSLIYLTLQVIPLWALMEGYGLDLSIWAAATVYMVIRLGTAIPNAPGNAGLQQFFCVLGLGLFNVPKSTAVGFSVIMFAVLTLPLLIGGFIALALTGLKLGDIHARAHGSPVPIEVTSD